ncbi:MAG: hypothetical protein DRP09_15740 [Candidatus Thorarchaeota archaeon]|nr:MAG: hypothetical protein DRP09_15740 [Candidatus Thorarchaeota archaeon]
MGNSRGKVSDLIRSLSEGKELSVSSLLDGAVKRLRKGVKGVKVYHQKSKIKEGYHEIRMESKNGESLGLMLFKVTPLKSGDVLDLRQRTGAFRLNSMLSIAVKGARA